MHYDKLKPAERKVVDEWFSFVNVPVGTRGGDRDGAITDHNWRRIVNLHFFEMLRDRLPAIHEAKWNRTPAIGFGLNQTNKLVIGEPKPNKVPKTKKPIIFYSGSSSVASQPEVVLGKEANVMLTYHDFFKKNKPDSRFRRILKARGHKFNEDK